MVNQSLGSVVKDRNLALPAQGRGDAENLERLRGRQNLVVKVD